MAGDANSGWSSILIGCCFSNYLLVALLSQLKVLKSFISACKLDRWGCDPIGTESCTEANMCKGGLGCKTVAMKRLFLTIRLKRRKRKISLKIYRNFQHISGINCLWLYRM